MNLPQGFLSSAVAGGIKKKGLDLGLILCPDGARAAGVFTSNVNASYSVEVCRKNISKTVRALIAHSGNANCFTHSGGLKDTLSLCSDCARLLGIRPDQVLIASTGIIGKKMPFKAVKSSMPGLIKGLGGKFDDFSQCILTTDTVKKTAGRTISIGKEKITITACAKGAGMINPNMATMLCFILTDADISRAWLNKGLKTAVHKSFNSISVDGCMSTNDSVFLLASGKGGKVRTKTAYDKFASALKDVCLELAQMIVKDGEGATKFIEIDVRGAKTEKEAMTAFQYIANSALFRTAMYGENPNWGRIVASLGHAGIRVREDSFKVKAGPLTGKDIRITVFLGRGKAGWLGWCCDFSPEYVKINAGYS